MPVMTTALQNIRMAMVAASAMAGVAISPAAAQKLGAGDRPTGANFAGRSPVLAQNGVAATAHPLATQIAVDILQRGGSAIDAAIAAHAALGLMEPMMSGVGGDLFAIIWDPETARLHGLNASGRSPAGFSLAEMRAAAGEGGVPGRGALAVSVPGAVDGWFELHERFGALPISEILAPAIAYARDGFPVTLQMAADWRMLENFRPGPGVIGDFENFRETFTIDGRIPEEGDIFRNPDLAAVYETIAAGGRDAFYRGEIADRIDAYMREIGGPLRGSDLAAHESDWVDPVSVSYRGYDVYELPMNTQGIAALQILNILEGYDFSQIDRFSAQFAHLFIEAKKLAYEDRALYYADRDDLPIDRLLSKEYAAERRALIDPNRARPVPALGDLMIEEGDTTYLTVADENGLVISFIASLASAFGSGLVPDDMGFALHNRGGRFSLIDGHPNIYAPGKRPFHTIIPAFVMKDGAPWLSFGLMGGAMQPQGHAQIVINMVDYGMNVQEAGDAARIRHMGGLGPRESNAPGRSVVGIETGYGAATFERLRALGHALSIGADGVSYGGYQAILIDRARGAYHAGSEMRKDGQASGY